MKLALIALLGTFLLQFASLTDTADDGESALSLRNPGYPDTYISLIEVDVTSPDHWVTLHWTGKYAKNQKTGPFYSSPGRGLGANDCDDLIESNQVDSNCTPKGRLIVEGFSETLPSNSEATFTTWIDMRREVAIHYYPEVPEYPASAGCIRLKDQEAAQLIHDNAVIGKTVVEIGGKWTRPVNRDKLREQLIFHEGRRSKVYNDSLDNPTIGVGFNLGRADAKESLRAVGAAYDDILAGEQTLSDEQIDSLLDRDIEEAIDNCHEIFPNFSTLTDVRQRVLVDMMFNLGLKRFQTFKKMISAAKARDFDKAADEMKDSRWYVQVKGRAVTLEAMMRTGVKDDEVVIVDDSEPIVDCRMTREEALDGIRSDCSEAVRNKLQLVDVEYYSFDGKLHQGQLLIDRALVSEIQVIFQIAREYRFPIGSVIPLSDPRFRKDGVWDDELSMEANNTSAFNFREWIGEQVRSQHALGRAIDINPMQNPYINRDVLLPLGASFDPSTPGTLSAEHPVVQAFLELGWEWGGFWRNQKGYQHFEKPLRGVH